MDALSLSSLLRDAPGLAESIFRPVSVYKMAISCTVVSRSRDGPWESDLTQQRVRRLNFDYLRNIPASSVRSPHAVSLHSWDPHSIIIEYLSLVSL